MIQKPKENLEVFASAPLQPDPALNYGILGGTPRFLASIRPGDDLAERLIAALLSSRGELHIQLDRIIEQEKGIRDPAEYRAILTAIAAGKTLLAEIADVTGLAERPHVVRRAVKVLGDLELVRRERDFDAPPKAPYRHRVADPAVRFWYRFVYPHRSRLETGDARTVWDRHVATQLDTYMGKAFEEICREAYQLRHDRWGLPGARYWARWEGRDRNRRSIEIDLVARLDDTRILTGEVKWSSRPIGPEVHRHLVRNLEDLGRSGHGWANDALDPDRSVGHLYFSANGFSDEFREQAHEDARIRLLDLGDLYEN